MLSPAARVMFDRDASYSVSLPQRSLSWNERAITSPAPMFFTVHHTRMVPPRSAVSGSVTEVTARSGRRVYRVSVQRTMLFSSEPFSNTLPWSSATTQIYLLPVTSVGRVMLQVLEYDESGSRVATLRVDSSCVALLRWNCGLVPIYTASRHAVPRRAPLPTFAI